MSAPTTTASRAGFTLIEVLAVLFLTALVLSAALSVYIDLSNDSTRSHTVSPRSARATASRNEAATSSAVRPTITLTSSLTACLP